MLFATDASSDVSQSGTLQVRFDGKLAPKRLPRIGLAPVAVSLVGDISTTNHSTPPQLTTITMAINRHGLLNPTGLPRCHYHDIQPASTVEARRACRSSLVGNGSFRANVVLPDSSPFPSNGHVLAFNGVIGCGAGEQTGTIPPGRLSPSSSRTQGAWRAPHASDRGRRDAKCHRRPVIFAHIFGTKPVPISQLVVFRIRRIEGTYRVVLSAQLPRVAAAWGYISGLSLTLKRTFRYHGTTHSYLSAGCPAPVGIDVASYPFARASFGFDSGQTLHSRLTRTCKVRR